jgi:glutamine amidotransferase
VIGIIDYGMGNLRSVQKALDYVGQESIISDDIQTLRACNGLILPGVGAFPDAMKSIRDRKIDKFLQDMLGEKTPILGICLGMQLLFEKGYEMEEVNGIGVIEGEVISIPSGVKIPHMGWNSLNLKNESLILKNNTEGDFVYFVHSFYARVKNEQNLNATTTYNVELAAAVSNKNFYGLQFHPEKSGDVGLKMLKAFGELIK